jgi:hypothetical protein
MKDSCIGFGGEIVPLARPRPRETFAVTTPRSKGTSMSIDRPQRALAARAAVAVLIPALALALPAGAAVDFNVSFDASADVLTATERSNITSHVQAAGARWVAAIGVSGTRSIEVEIAISDIPTANGASVTTAYLGTIDGRDAYEQGAAHELRTGEDPNGADPDALITIGLDYLRNELWFDPDPTARTAPVPANRTDAMSTILHELGHVFAYNGWADLFTGVPNPDYWSIFDSWIAPGSSPTFEGPAAVAAWGTPPALTIGNIFHWGNSARAGGGRCDIAPITWRFGAPSPNVCSAPPSGDAPREADGVPSLIDQLMNGVVFYRGTRYDISALDVGVLVDVGLIDDHDAIFANGFE